MKPGLVSLLLLAATPAVAQDRIFITTQKAPIEGEVVEINSTEIKFKPSGRPYPMTTLDKQDVMKIVYSNGEVFMISNPLKDFAAYTGQHRWNAKIDLLSPVLGYTNLYLEHSQKPGRSVEYQLNIIGLGKDQILDYTFSGLGQYRDVYMRARGAGLGIGMKFLKLPDYVNGPVRLRHILQGSYIKPGISASYYSRNFTGRDMNGMLYLQRKPVFTVMPSITVGRQYILDNTISIELYATVGYSVDNVRKQETKVRNDRMSNQQYWYSYNQPFNNFGATRFSGGDMGLALNGGIRIGYLFDMKKQKKND